MSDLNSVYLGLSLASPIVVSSCGLTATVKNVKQCAEAGAGAVVLKSLFEEQIDAELEDSRNRDEQAPHPEAEEYVERMGKQLGPESYLELISGAKASTSIPVIASVNCVTDQWWTDWAAQIERAGADGLELNISIMPRKLSETSDGIEDRFVQIVSSVRKSVQLPIAVKIGPYFTALPRFASRLQAAGADALVLFNRFYQLDIDTENVTLQPGYRLSSQTEQHATLRWISILYGQLECQLAAATGVDTGQDAVKMLLAGASCVQVASALYRHGVEHIRTLNDGVRMWLEEKRYDSVHTVRGLLSQQASDSPAAYERLQYIKALTGVS